jgi:hypothetical protein
MLALVEKSKQAREASSKLTLDEVIADLLLKREQRLARIAARLAPSSPQPTQPSPSSTDPE